VGVIEVYGARKVPLKKIKSTLGFAEGDVMPPSRGNIEDRLDKISGVLASRLEASCCEDRKMTVYVGIEEPGNRHFVFHQLPTGSVAFPEALADQYREFLDAVSASLRRGKVDEDLTNGYSLMADPDCRDHQRYFLSYASDNLPAIEDVIHHSADGEQRTIAAYLLQYGPRGAHTTQDIVDDLQYALLDAEDTVRETAIESLRAILVGGRLHPEERVHIEPTWLIELMNSVVWTDRRDASEALVNLTDKHDPTTLNLLRERALDSVVEMARWHDQRHALPGFILAGRIAGLSEQEIQDAWADGNREPVLDKALFPNGKKSIFGSAGSLMHKTPKDTTQP
jgi:Fe-S-cluster formation regulator IscX/YfhJ